MLAADLLQLLGCLVNHEQQKHRGQQVVPGLGFSRRKYVEKVNVLQQDLHQVDEELRQKLVRVVLFVKEGVEKLVGEHALGALLRHVLNELPSVPI